MTLTDHVAIITGASSGIGAATARVLSEAGMRLVLTARREDRLRQLAAQLPTEAAIVPGDITGQSMPQSLIDTALKSFGRCDAVVNNAGIMIAAPIDSLDLDAMSRMIQVNVDAAFRLAYTALRYFKSVNRGYLVNTSSILGTKIRPTAGAYAGTKFAIEALTEALRIELAGTAVKISSVQPGLVMTELHDNFPVHPKDSLNIQHPLQPEDIARAIRWLLEQPPHVRVPKVMLTAGEQAL